MGFLSDSRSNETLSSLSAPVTTTAAATAQSLGAFSLPADALRRNGQSLRITAFGTVGTNANTKTIALRFGGTALNASATGTTSNGAWLMRANVVRNTASTQQAMCDGYAFAAALAPVNTALTKDLTAAQVIDVLGTNGSASADVTLNGMLIEGLSE